MAVVTSWVKPAPATTGQDHLGTIAPAESIYSVQLPGITNVTARARYYSFYPWFLRELETRRPNARANDFAGQLRRAECLFALAAIRHARTLSESDSLHGATMVGRDKLVPAVDTAGDRGGIVRLGEHAAADDSQLRYFKNPLGGLGQYYFGPLRELGILGGDTRGGDVKYTEERGRPLADSFGRSVDAGRFFELLDDDEVSLDALDDLAAFCPCALAASAGERRQLIDLIVDPTGRLGDEARPRRGTLSLILDLTAKEAAPEYDFSGEFRASTYTGALLDGSPWTVSESLAPSLFAWSSYARHELLSVAFQGLFWAALTAAEAAGRRKFRDASDLAHFAVEQLRPAVPAPSWALTFEALVRTTKLPLLGAWSDDRHEVKAGWRIVAGDATAATATADAVAILVAVTARAALGDPYARLHFEADYFDRYPINLRSFLGRAKGEWATKTMPDVLAAWIVWALRTHWRIALQKLGDATPRDTFKVRPLEGEIQVVGAPPPTFSSPRIHRAVGILRDLEVVAYADRERPILTKDGVKLREALLG
jgi:hypothetical protein